MRVSTINRSSGWTALDLTSSGLPYLELDLRVLIFLTRQDFARCIAQILDHFGGFGRGFPGGRLALRLQAICRIFQQIGNFLQSEHRSDPDQPLEVAPDPDRRGTQGTAPLRAWTKIVDLPN